MDLDEVRLMKIAIIPLCAGLFCGSAFADKEPSTSHLPAAVQNGIKESKGKGQIKKVTTRKQADGKTVYEIEYKERGEEKFVVFAEDGSVLSESAGKGAGKGRDKEKKEKNKKNNKSSKGEHEESDEKEEKEVENTRAVSRPASERPAATPPTPATPAQTPPVPTTPAPTSTRPVVRPSTSGNNQPAPTVNRQLGETRYLYWDSIPEAVRSAALAQQSQHGTINTKALRVQKVTGRTVYHVPYEKQSVSFADNGSVFSSAQQGGGPLRPTKWDDLPEPTRKAALAAQRTSGNVKLDVIFAQGNGGKTLYHVLFGNDVVYAYSTSGRVEDPATFWR